MERANASVNMILNVSHVGRGGNTADGEYFYNFEPNIVNIVERETDINFVLSYDSTERFSIIHLFSTDGNQQLDRPIYTDDGNTVTVRDHNTHEQLILFSILVRDNKTGKKVNCDPQATNCPD